MPTDEALTAVMPAMARQGFSIVLEPISHPELGEICIKDDLFAVGRTEPPFETYAADLVAGLSRRHARIFSEHGAAYVADLDSKNGTTVNGLKVRGKPGTLHDGDEIAFGPDLSYRVRVTARARAPRRVARLVSLTLTPVRKDLGLQPIVLTQFPFLIGKSDDTFSRYESQHPHQVSYLSRRHAHIFVKDATPLVEDLGSTNGTFVGGQRLEEHAVPLEDGDLVGFGGSQFVYRASLQRVLEDDATLTRAPPAVPGAAPESSDPEKTTFVVSAASFLDIFCVDHVLEPGDEVSNEAPKQPEDAKPETVKDSDRSRAAVFLSELTRAFAGSERQSMSRALRWGAALVSVLGVAVSGLYLWGASEREIKDLFASGEYVRAATAADRYLGRHPDDAEIRALSTEALLKGNVPDWLTSLRAGDFDRASAALAGMKQLAGHNRDARTLVGELEWMGDLEQFVMRRGGVDAPIRIYADEEGVKRVLARWNEDTPQHQRAFATISAFVPEFRDAYAEALSHLRKLQNDDSVLLAASERLKAAITAELERDTPDALETTLKEYSEKYPRLGGLDAVRRDLRQYLEVESEVRARRLGRLVALLEKVRFATPPFQAKFRSLASSNRFPPADVVRPVEAASRAWREGDATAAFAALQGLSAGPWADAASRELEREKAIVRRYTALQDAHGTGAYEERLLAFYGSLDPDQDAYFMRATEADVGRYRDGALTRARESFERAEALWREYRENGAIKGRERLQESVSNKFRAQAQLLSEANEEAQRGMHAYAQLKVAHPARWITVYEEIKAEAELQRKALLDLRNVLEPGPLKAKLALLEGRNDDRRSKP
jgi:pSer/pThr/pTyr-binding forkhead associated (FHA) protein